ncbi:MAG: hypothetical protein KDK10_01880 [Maritimibacter sp.]|nr:hypothetical protein [Maritimibacter sp.]
MNSYPDIAPADAAARLAPGLVLLPGGNCALFCFTGLDAPLPETARLRDARAPSWRARSWPTAAGYASLAIVGASALGDFRAIDPARGTTWRVASGGPVSTEAADLAALMFGAGVPAPELLYFLGEALSAIGAAERTQRFLADLLVQTSTADGYVEMVLRPERGGLFLQGWTHRGLAGALNLHGQGAGVAAVAATFARDDVRAPAAGFCVFAGDWKGGLDGRETLFVDHDQRLLRLDVVTAAEPVAGAAATDHLRAILPRLSAPAEALDALRRITRARFDGRNTAAGHPGPVSAALDRVMATPAGGIFVSGWLLDPLDQVERVNLVSSAGLNVPLDDRWHRADRPDLNQAYAADPRFAGLLDPRDRLHGFACTVIAEPDMVNGAALHLELVLMDNACLFLPCEVVQCEGDGSAHPVMEALQPDDPGLRTLISDHAAPFLATVPQRPVNLARMTVQPLAGGAGGRETAAVMPLADIAHLQPVMASLADTPEADELDLVLVANREGAATLSEELDFQFRFFGLRGTLVLVPDHEPLGRRLDAGAKVARAGEILVWQPAVLPKSPRWLATLRRAARELGERAVVAPLLSYEDGSVYFGGGTSGAAPAGAPCSLVGFARRRLDDSGPRPAQALPAEIVLVNRDLIAAAGGFRGGLLGERFVGQDLSQRLAREGAAAWCVPQAEFWMLDATPAGAAPGERSMVDRIDAALIAQRAAAAPVAQAANLELIAGGLRG